MPLLGTEQGGDHQQEGDRVEHLGNHAEDDAADLLVQQRLTPQIGARLW